VRAVEGRAAQRISFPKLTGYRLEIPDEGLFLPDELEPFVIGPNTVPTWTEAAPIVGAAELIEDDARTQRAQAIAFRLARRLVAQQFALGDEVGGDGVRSEPRPWLFPSLVRLCREWIDRAVVVESGFHLGYLWKYALWEAQAADAVHAVITSVGGDRRARLRPMLRRFDPVGSTADVSFPTRKVALLTEPERCEVSHVVLDGPQGNTWEQLTMAFCEHDSRVAAYVKNDHLGFTIPYVHEGRSHDYLPDFLLRVKRAEYEVIDRTFIVEVSGGQKSAHSPGSVQIKAATTRDSWCPAGTTTAGSAAGDSSKVTNPTLVKDTLAAAITSLYADGPILGPADLLDYDEVTRYAAAR